jgi:hypothetical protein
MFGFGNDDTHRLPQRLTLLRADHHHAIQVGATVMIEF